MSDSILRTIISPSPVREKQIKTASHFNLMKTEQIVLKIRHKEKMFHLIFTCAFTFLVSIIQTHLKKKIRRSKTTYYNNKHCKNVKFVGFHKSRYKTCIPTTY